MAHIAGEEEAAPALPIRVAAPAAATRSGTLAPAPAVAMAPLAAPVSTLAPAPAMVPLVVATAQAQIVPTPADSMAAETLAVPATILPTPVDPTRVTDPD